MPSRIHRVGAGIRTALDDISEYRVVGASLQSMPLSSVLRNLVWAGWELAHADAPIFDPVGVIALIRRDPHLRAICSRIASRGDRTLSVKLAQTVWLPLTEQERKTLQEAAGLLGWSEGKLMTECLRDATYLGGSELPVTRPPFVASRYRALRRSLRRTEMELLSRTNHFLEEMDRQTRNKVPPALEALTTQNASTTKVSLGRGTSGEAITVDLANPEFCHAIIIGSAGSGKTEMLRAIASDLASRNAPSSLRLILIDPKGRSFLSAEGSPFLASTLLTTAQEASVRLKTLLDEVDGASLARMPGYVVMIDGLDELLLTGDGWGEDLERQISKIAARGRQGRIHLFLATRALGRPISGSLLAQLPLRIFLKMKRFETTPEMRRILRAAKLKGNGDFVYCIQDGLVRGQSYFIGNSQMERLFLTAAS